MRHRRRPFATLAALGLIAAGLACGRNRIESATPAIPFDPPEVALRDVRLRGVGITGGALDLELRVYNPNDYQLTAPRVNYRVLVDRQELATGFTDLDVVVPSRDSATVRVPASFSYLSMGRAGRSLMNSGAAPYRVLGRITVGTPYGRLSFPYDRAGNFATLNAGLQRSVSVASDVSRCARSSGRRGS